MTRKTNRWKTPWEVSTGETPDISACLEFKFWEKVLYHSCDESFPDSHELPGYFLLISENCGDALTFYILKENKKIISRRVVHPYDSDTDPNLRGEFQEPSKPPQEVELSLAQGSANLKHLHDPPTFEPLECMGEHLVFMQDDHPIKVTIEKALHCKTTHILRS